MKNTKYLLIFLFISLISKQSIHAQIDTLVIHFKETQKPFIELINDIETKYPVRFYYKKNWIDTIKLGSDLNDTKLKVLLSELLPNYGLNYLVDDKNNVFLLKKEINLKLDNNDKIITSEIDINNIEKPDHGEIYQNDESVVMDKVILGKKGMNTKKNASIIGSINDKETGEPLIGTSIYIEELKTGTVADANGNYVLSIPKGEYILSFQSVGKETKKIKVSLFSDDRLNISLKQSLVALDEVIVKEDRYDNTRGMQLGFEQITMKEIKEIPPIAGERDILKSSLLLPGVQTVGESAAGYNIRGGTSDQNLFLINNVPVYNTSHMFGFFSTFNPEVVRNFNLFKSNIPIEYGGRISSVFDIQTKNGNNKNFSLKGGISPISAKLSAEGPIVKDKSSYIVGLRSTYSNWILKHVDNPDIRNSNIYFYDMVANFNYSINENNNIGVFGYYSMDNFRLPTNTSYNYANIGSSINWQHFFGQKLYANLSLIYSNYDLEVTDKQYVTNSNIFNHNIQHYELKHKFSYSLNSNHELKFGYSAILYGIEPGSYSPENAESTFTYLNLEKEQAVESAVYIGDRFDINHKLGIEGGLRYSFYNYLGPKTVYNYLPDELPSSANLLDTSFYNGHESVKKYNALDIRISVRYLINADNSIKLGYNKITQYLFLLTNTIAVSPTDRWKLSDSYAPPSNGEQFNIGYYSNFRNTNFEASVEMYYKNMNNLKEFKNGSDPEKNEFIERDLLIGTGRSYGIEFMIKKPFGRLNGWLNYTYSRSELKFDGKSIEEIINNGEYFPSNSDKPHNINLTANLKANRRLSISTNFTYSTGRPTTFPVSKSLIGTLPVINYSNRNEARIPDYIRLDLAINLEGNLLRKKIAHAFWTFSIYNLLGRNNAYSLYFTSEQGKIKGNKLSIFSNPVVTLSYNFKLGNYSSN